ncbi:cation transporter [Dictyobacter alpinus]|uniref:Cation transporter n=1 Tax=Dictyobacter alpinus TaxID=2014873 RepID=A0A402BFG9_9CHLR|nr:heavy metal translocating P-type ATPase [Dictyobacter alpinus]GCE30138.1 cation transporter [Dictyobacter alpinus]
MVNHKLAQKQVPSTKQRDAPPLTKEETQTTWHTHYWSFFKRYPIPVVALILLASSGLLWLLRRDDLANWLLLAIIVWGGIPLLWGMVGRLWHREFGIDIIAALAIVGSLLLHEYLAGSIIVLMLSGGEALEAYALRRASSSLSALAERAPRTTHVWEDQQLLDIPVETVQPGMVVVIKPGELVPVDGVIVQGTSNVSQADLTGEPMPVRKTPGMGLLSGSVNLDGILEVRASKPSADSKYAQIVRLVTEAQAQKAPIHRLADRYSVVFTLFTIILASVTWLLSGNQIYALAVLVVATPCPLILATPIAIMSGINIAARNGIIVKSGAAIEQLGEVDIAVFDKTGTLTLGMPKISSILLATNSQYTEEEILRYAASVEQLSTHILATAIVNAGQERQVALYTMNNFEETFGKGVCATIAINQSANAMSHPGDTGQIKVAVGNRTFIRMLDIPLPAYFLEERERRRDMGQICSFVALNHFVEALIIMEDVPRPEIRQLCPALKHEGIKQTILLTGDSETVAQQVGKLANIDRVVARCLPEDKVRVIQDLEAAGHKVLMVGDGINDAPALATATVGMALGTQGLTAAASAADAVLLSTNILGVDTAIFLGRRVMRIARQGIWIGIGLSSVAMVFAAFGYLPPAIGAILQEGIDVLVIFNALRVSAIQVRKKDSQQVPPEKL